MFQHSLLLIYRNFKRFRSTFFINLIGLSTGLASALLIYLWVHDELSFDRFHEKDSQLYQVMVNEEFSEGIKTGSGTGGLLAETLVKEFPEIEYATLMTPPGWFQKFTVTSFGQDVSASGNFVSKDYFNVFSFNLVQGDKRKLLIDKNSMVLSESLAKKLFGTTESIVGKAIEWKWSAFKYPCIITGVYKDMPSNSSYQFDFMVPIDVWNDIVAPGLNGGPFSTFVILKEGANLSDINNKIAHFLKDKFEDSKSTLFLKHFSDGYLYGKYDKGIQAGGRIEFVRLFSIIAIFILLIACINFTNLTTAKASARIKEVGLKKAIGAHRKTLIYQYLGESLVMSFLSLAIAVVLVQLTLPEFNEITSKRLDLSFDWYLLLVVVAITVITGILAGSYPALYLSRFSSAMVLKGKVNSFIGELWTRKGLVVLQFSVSVIFIVSVLVVYDQIQFITAKGLGYASENIIYFEAEGAVIEKQEAFISALKSIPGVINASSAQQKLIADLFGSTGVRWDGKNYDDRVRFAQMPVNYDLIETLGIKIHEGRTFSREFGADTAALIFNEAAIDAMGLEEPIGKTIRLWDRDVKIIGVTKNFYFQSLHEEVKPFFFRLSPREAGTIMVRIKPGMGQETINKLRELNKLFNPEFTLDYRFLNNDFQAQYAAEKRVGALSKYFAAIAIITSSLGLFGLAAFTAERRTKEIGIRKVLGSTPLGIVWLLSSEFTKPVLVAMAIALPIGYFITRHWLDSFAYRIELESWHFVVTGIIAMLIAWLAVGAQAIKAASTKTTHCLREE